MKKFLFGITGIFVAFSLAACGGQKSVPPETSAETKTLAKTETESTVPAADTVDNSGHLLDEPVVFKVAASDSATSDVGKYIIKGCEAVTEATNGDIRFEYFWDNSLGSIADYLEAMRSGVNILGVYGFDSLSEVVKDFMPASFPYTYNDMYEVFDIIDTDYMADINKQLYDNNIVNVAYFTAGYRHFCGNTAVHTADDLKGLIVRMGPATQAQNFAAVCGGSPTTSNWADNYSMLQTGAIDLCEAAFSMLSNSSLYEVADYVSLSGHMVTPCTLSCNVENWEALPEEYQEIFSKCMQESMYELADALAQSEENFIEEFKEKGVTIIDDVDKESFAKKLPELYERMGIDYSVYQDIRAAIEK